MEQTESSGFDHLEKSELLAIIDDFAKNWLAHDGLWFQAMEKRFGLEAAIEADIDAWRAFSPIEARRIMKRHHIPENGGLEALIEALGFRMYARLNKQRVIRQSDQMVVFRMEECRVQAARTRKGMPLFPCKSVGIVEYETFASTIDPRIKTEVIRCPPDLFNNEYYCAWQFSLGDQ